MATAVSLSDSLKDLEKELIRMANAQFESDAFKRLLGLRFTKERARMYVIQRTHWTVNRRECWALVQSAAPMPVKRVIWEHEREELEGDPSTGKADHYTMNFQEGAARGLAPEDFERVAPSDGCLTCCYAWLHLARTGPWLTALAASSALEMSNSDEILEGGAMSRRIGVKMRDEAGIPLKKQAVNVEHTHADVEHAHMMMDIAADYATGEAEKDLILDGARKSWAIDRIWKGHLADLLAAIPE
ncbi:MAG TPA: iron-containing redox enzyme family protein [Alphaproteobacteria bacterium]|nr:iron-containing redox enzyme family protein [Alphaproteobacteria bacterium]